MIARPFRALGALAFGVAGYFIACAAPVHAADDSSASIIMYHRFGDERYPSTNIRIDQFEAHIAELTGGGYHVMPLPEIVAAVRAGRALPSDTVGITIDDAFLSVYREAWPRLRAAGLPFTLFVATGPVDRGLADYMSWAQIREMAAAGVTIGGHTVRHAHMPFVSDKQNRAELAAANARLEAELGKAPTLFAYPYGEISPAVRQAARDAGYVAAFGQHSGVIFTGSDFFNLPRFSLNEHYGDLARLRLAARALPLPVRDVTPADTFLATGANPPLYGFTLAADFGKRQAQLACYVSGRGKARLERLGPKRIEVRMNAPFRPGRTRINCTMPAGEGRWRWYGRQFLVPRR